MLFLDSLESASEVFKALSTPMRLRIMELIYERELSMNDLAEALGLTNSAISLHVSKLESAGLVAIRTTSGKRGIMKIVQPMYSRLIVDMAPQSKPRHCHQDDIAIGHYSSCDVHPTCGLATPTYIIGALDTASRTVLCTDTAAEALILDDGVLHKLLTNLSRTGLVNDVGKIFVPKVGKGRNNRVSSGLTESAQGVCLYMAAQFFQLF